MPISNEMVKHSFLNMKKVELIFLPMPGIGHLVSTLKFATQLLDRDDRFSVTILVSKMPFDSIPIDTLSKRHHLGSHPDRIRYVYLPPVDPPPPELFSDSMEAYASAVTERYKPHVRDAIINHVSASTTNTPLLAGLVLDLFFSSIIDVGRELGVPCYIFSTCGAANLGFMLYLEHRRRRLGVELENSDSNSEFIVPSFVHPVPTSVFPSFCFNKSGYSAMMSHVQKFREANGIILNTFAELQPHAMSWLVGDQTPPIYPVGPVLDLKSEHSPSTDENRNTKIMKWLDDKPPSSVVFLCFGSWGSFDAPQVREIAIGLENSGKSFLWSLRHPPRGDKAEWPTDFNDDEYNHILPNGFLERTEGKGMVCGWVRQVEILAHKSIGSFVSHCGWNSILESIWHGVPLVAWPLYAEQQINAFEVVREMGIAVEMKMDYRRGGGDVVGAEQIEKAVRIVMEGDSVVRKKVKEASAKGRIAVRGGGSSYLSLGRLIDNILI